MNAPVLDPVRAKPRISVDDLFHMMERGVIDPDAKFELVEGEIVPMAPQGPLHQQLQRWLHQKLTLALADRFWVAPGSTLILPKFTALDPDICVYPLDVSTSELSGEKVSLLVEIAVSSRAYDLGRKARLYARMGVQELWVVDAEKRETHVHRRPAEERWRETAVLSVDAELSPLAVPELKLRLADAG